jgi:pyruvate/2-oxoglutarate dehydrogenase complex dihydrolipoamide acyltransferase (E2) component
MGKRVWLISIAGAALLTAGAVAQQPAPQATQQQERATATQQTKAGGEKIHGYDLLTEQERGAYHAQMRAAKSDQERERIRNEHRELVQQRAKEKGVDVKGMAYGPGPGAGPGKGGGASAKGR